MKIKFNKISKKILFKKRICLVSLFRPEAILRVSKHWVFLPFVWQGKDEISGNLIRTENMFFFRSLNSNATYLVHIYDSELQALRNLPLNRWSIYSHIISLSKNHNLNYACTLSCIYWCSIRYWCWQTIARVTNDFFAKKNTHTHTHIHIGTSNASYPTAIRIDAVSISRKVLAVVCMAVVSMGSTNDTHSKHIISTLSAKILVDNVDTLCLYVYMC